MDFVHMGHHGELRKYYRTAQAGSGLCSYDTERIFEVSFSFAGQAGNRKPKRLFLEPQWAPVPWTDEFAIAGYKAFFERPVGPSEPWAWLTRIDTDPLWGGVFEWAATRPKFEISMLEADYLYTL